MQPAGAALSRTVCMRSAGAELWKAMGCERTVESGAWTAEMRMDCGKRCAVGGDANGLWKPAFVRRNVDGLWKAVHGRRNAKNCGKRCVGGGDANRLWKPAFVQWDADGLRESELERRKTAGAARCSPARCGPLWRKISAGARNKNIRFMKTFSTRLLTFGLVSCKIIPVNRNALTGSSRSQEALQRAAVAGSAAGERGANWPHSGPAEPEK